MLVIAIRSELPWQIVGSDFALAHSYHGLFGWYVVWIQQIDSNTRIVVSDNFRLYSDEMIPNAVQFIPVEYNIIKNH